MSTRLREDRDPRTGVEGMHLLLCIEHRVSSGLNLLCLAVVLKTLDNFKHFSSLLWVSGFPSVT